jgi:hypothetical protein
MRPPSRTRIFNEYDKRASKQAAGAHALRRPFRGRGSRREEGMARLFSFGHMTLARTITVFLLAAVAVVFTGCTTSESPASELRVTNHTGGSIVFITAFTRYAVHIPAGATCAIPLVVGRVTIITQQHEAWNYEAIDVPDFRADTLKEFNHVTLPLTIEPSGIMTLPSGRTIEPSQKMELKQ